MSCRVMGKVETHAAPRRAARLYKRPPGGTTAANSMLPRVNPFENKGLNMYRR